MMRLLLLILLLTVGCRQNKVTYEIHDIHAPVYLDHKGLQDMDAGKETKVDTSLKGLVP